MVFYNNKLGNVTFILAITLVSILGFFVIFANFVNIGNKVVNQSDDILCKSLVTFKDLSKMGFGFFLYEINNKCKVDYIKNIDLEKKDESFNEIAIEMSRCWQRYGEGKQDFLSNWDTEGSWCFECGSISFKDNSASWSYNDYIDWTTKNYASKEDERNKTSFFDIINLKYAKVSDDGVQEIRQEFTNIINDPNGDELDPSLIPMIQVLGNQIEYLDDLRTKSISASDEKIYVVYRFDRINKSYDQQINDASFDALSGSAGGVLLSIGAEMAAEGILWGTVSGGICAVSVIATVATPVCGLVGGVVGSVVGTVKGIFKTTKATIKITEKLLKITILSNKIKSLVKSSKSIDKSAEMVEIGYKSSKAIKLSKKITNFKATKEEIKIFAEIADKSGDSITSKNLNILIEWMTELKIDNMVDIEKKILSNKNTISNLEKIVMDNNLYNKIGREVADVSSNLNKEVGDLKALKELAVDEISRIKSGTDIVEPIGIANYLRVFVIVGGGLSGAYLGNELNSNYQQYIDLLTREQYYRQCGTQRYIN